MNWDAIGALAELLAAVSVIGSLIYVAFQVRASTVASRVESKLRMTETMVNYADLLISSLKLNELMIVGRKGIAGLSKSEYLQFSNMALKACWYLSAGFFMHQHNSVSDDDWYELKTIALYWSRSKGFQEWWADRGSLSFTGKFARFIENEIELANKAKKG
jgi:hypothetical protein